MTEKGLVIQMSIILEVQNLSKTYTVNKHQNHVLRGVDFTVSEGEMVAVMGPSGSGKSTLLYAVSGMDSFQSGDVRFCGKSITGLSQKDLAQLRLEEMGFIFQQMYMLKNLTVLDNILLPARQAGKLPKKEILARGQALMEKLGIADIADSDITAVSGGQLQRACICRSLINQPKMLFADEPTGALNRAASDEVMEELTKLNREGATLMLVTHDVKVAARCSRVLYLVDGNIQGTWTADGPLKSREQALHSWLADMGW